MEVFGAGRTLRVEDLSPADRALAQQHLVRIYYAQKRRKVQGVWARPELPKGVLASVAPPVYRKPDPFPIHRYDTLGRLVSVGGVPAPPEIPLPTRLLRDEHPSDRRQGQDRRRKPRP